MKEWGRRRERGRGSCTAAPPAGAAEGRRRVAGPPRRCPACRRGRLRRGSCAWPLRSQKSPSQGHRRPSRSRPWSSHPFTEPNRLLPLHRLIRRLAGTPRGGAATPGRCRRGSHGPRRPTSPAPGHSTLLVTTSSPPCTEREVSTEAFTLLWTRPSSRGWTEPYALAVCLLTAAPHRATAQTRHRLRAGHRAEPVACRCCGRHRRARSLALQSCRTFVPTSARRVPARRRHPHTEHATVERRPCFYLAWSRVSTNPCRAHVVGVVPSPRLCRRPFTRTHQHRVEALFFLAEPVHAHSRTREVVRRRRSPNQRRRAVLRCSPVLVPCLVHAINFVSLPWPCHRRSACTRTHATKGPSPCFTYL
jgi:hypothetical protein